MKKPASNHPTAQQTGKWKWLTLDNSHHVCLFRLSGLRVADGQKKETKNKNTKNKKKTNDFITKHDVITDKINVSKGSANEIW